MENKKMARRRGLFVGVFASVLTLGIIGVSVASTDSPAKDYVAQKLVDYIQANPNSEIASKLADWVIGKEDEAFGSITSVRGNEQSSNFNQIGYIDEDNPSDGLVREGWIVEKIGTASSTFVSVKNNYTQPLYVDRAIIKLAGTATTTVRFSLGTSTLNAVAYNASVVPNSLLDRRQVVTSTPESIIIDSLYGPMSGGVPTPAGTATGTSYATIWNQGDYLLGHMSAEHPIWAVTSTNARGFTADSRVWIHYFLLSTSTPQ